MEIKEGQYNPNNRKINQRRWAAVNRGGETFAVKVMNSAGMYNLSFRAREKKGETGIIYYNSEFLGIVEDEEAIKKLQRDYYKKRG
jgi:hypothetical protein